MAHQLLTVLELSALLKKSFGVGLLSGEHVRVDVFVHRAGHGLGHVVPVDLELGDSWFFSQDMASESVNLWLGRRILDHLWVVILHIYVVSHSQELLAVLVRTC